MTDKPKTQQVPFGRRRFRFLFIFRISPGFFVGFVPRRFAHSSDYSDNYHGGHYDDNCSYHDDDMCIRRINEQEYMCLRRLGIDEIDVVM